jgi:lysozyme
MTPAGLARLKLDEGCKLVAYPDPDSGGDPWTIGYGQTGAGIGPGVRWSQAQAEAALAGMVAQVEQALWRDLAWGAPLDPVRQDVLVNIAYNVGVEGLEHWPNTLAHVEYGEYDLAANDLLTEGKWNRDVGDRAVRLSAAMKSGEWPAI